MIGILHKSHLLYRSQDRDYNNVNSNSKSKLFTRWVIQRIQSLDGKSNKL